MHIRDNVFVVSGGASGLGAAVVRMLVEEGARVIIADLQQEAAQALAEDCGSAARFVSAVLAASMVVVVAIISSDRAPTSTLVRPPDQAGLATTS